jgi:hypothetical protein
MMTEFVCSHEQLKQKNDGDVVAKVKVDPLHPRPAFSFQSRAPQTSTTNVSNPEKTALPKRLLFAFPATRFIYSVAHPPNMRYTE